MKITQDVLPSTSDINVIEWSEWFHYDETSPSKLRWRVDRWGGNLLVAAKDSVAGCRSNKEYYSVKFFGKSYLCHRIIFVMMSGEALLHTDFIDHFDGDATNNTYSNLRKTNRVGNGCNRKKNRDNKSGVVGVCKTTNGKGSWYWCASYTDIDRKLIRVTFSITTMGDLQAFEAACKFRLDGIRKLKEHGVPYTDRHVGNNIMEKCNENN